MASIVKRKNRYSVVYSYTDENGVKRQKWETFATNAEAKKRKVQIEFEQGKQGHSLCLMQELSAICLKIICLFMV